MKFTDDDLKQLNEDIAAVKPGGKWEGGHPWSIQGDRLDALISRLEAAECALYLANRVIHETHSSACDHEKLACAYADIQQQWRKAAGK